MKKLIKELAKEIQGLKANNEDYTKKRSAFTKGSNGYEGLTDVISLNYTRICCLESVIARAEGMLKSKNRS